MDSSIIVVTLVVALTAIAVLLTIIAKVHTHEGGLSPLAGIAFGCIAAGFVTSDDQLVSCALFVVGVVMAIVDIIRKSKQKGNTNHKA